jgi:CubicO group peptidase (beta-lactamase class C family)
MRLLRGIALTGMLAAAAAGAAFAASSSLPRAKPESAGFSVDRLKRLDTALQRQVDAGELAGIVTLVARNGKLVHAWTYGYQNLDARTPMKEDTIFQIYSMTKPITGVAMMLLHEEGKWSPSDPLSKHIPQFANLKVFAGLDEKGQPILQEPVHPPTVGELMTHTAGFTYGLSARTPVDNLYREKKPLEAASLEEMIQRLAELPLAYQPGTQWVYSIGVDIQGYLVEKLSGQSLPDLLRERIFEPLGMTDTDFIVPESKLSRLATTYATRLGPQGLVPLDRDPDISKIPKLPSGGGGLYSTAHDYLRFAQMLLNGGELKGVRLLAPRTVALMRSNHLPEHLMDGTYGVGFQRIRPGFGFGYDVAVFTDPYTAGTTVGAGSYLWDGAAGTWFWVDPTNNVVFVGMIQRLVGPNYPDVQPVSRTLTYQALLDTRP